MFELIVIVVCLLINAFLSASETAFIAVSKPSLRELIKQGNEKAKLLLSLRENPERTLSITQIGITFLGAFAAAVGGAGAEESVAPWIEQHLNVQENTAEVIALLVVVSFLTYINVVIGELVPKTLALRRPMFIASKSAPWLHRISRLIGPIVTFFEWSTKQILNSFPKKHVISESGENEDFIGLHTLTEHSKQYVLNLVKIENTTVREIIVPWSEVVFLNETQSLWEAEHIFVTSGHTRLPVLRGDTVIGMINAKEFLAFLQTKQPDWLSLLRPAVKTSESTPLLTALRIMQEYRSHMGIVYDRDEEKAGIVTMEAIFEEIVGDIYDEDDDGSVTKILSSVHFKNPLHFD